MIPALTLRKWGHQSIHRLLNTNASKISRTPKEQKRLEKLTRAEKRCKKVKEALVDVTKNFQAEFPLVPKNCQCIEITAKNLENSNWKVKFTSDKVNYLFLSEDERLAIFKQMTIIPGFTMLGISHVYGIQRPRRNEDDHDGIICPQRVSVHDITM